MALLTQYRETNPIPYTTTRVPFAVPLPESAVILGVNTGVSHSFIHRSALTKLGGGVTPSRRAMQIKKAVCSARR